MDFAPIICDGAVHHVRTGRKPRAETAIPRKEQSRRWYEKRRDYRLTQIAVLDMETDEFSDKRGEIYPFCCEIYSDQFDPIVIWDEDFDSFCERVYNAIFDLPGKFIIYAHNGGKFDFMFLIKKLRGRIKFKGRSIMSARIGNHELRDSLHLLPEKLSSWKKDTFDYTKMAKGRRNKYKDEILAYQHSDCVYLFDFLKRFIKEFGLKISIGSAAFSELKKHYKLQNISETMDTALRPYYFGGRVECIAGRGEFTSRFYEKPYKLFDVNSMYPAVMASTVHPVSADYVWHRGEPGPNTFFLDVSCRSYGAFLKRRKADFIDPFTKEPVTLQDDDTFDIDDHTGRFFTTIYEFNMALKYNLIDNVEINWCVDNKDKSDFSKFIVPMYLRRQEIKAQMKMLKAAGKQDSPEFEELKKEDLFLKYLMNNSYGKCSQNPRRYQEFYLTDHGKMPEGRWFDFLHSTADGSMCGCPVCHKYRFPVERSNSHDVWSRPNPGKRFNNVGIAASITGAARAVLMEARQNAVDPVYCDTDSLIARELNGVEIHPTKLGAWDLEETFDDVIITGKKTYACKIAGEPDCSERRLKVRSKGVDLRVRPNRDGVELTDPTPDQWEAANRATWNRYVSILDEQIIETFQRAPTISKTGAQFYIPRRIRATAPFKSNRGIIRHGTPGIQIGAR